MFKSLIFIALASLVLGAEKKDLSSITKNAIYTTRLLRVEAEMQLYPLIKSKLSGVKNDEIKACMNKIKDDAITESDQIINDSIGAVLNELTEAGKKLADGDNESVQSWFEQYDYEAEKTKARKQFSSNIQNLVPRVEADLDKCGDKE